ncbi:L-fucose:H+ symporter permease [Rubritalea marina]|uniref:L-fucose:H+ symporter permease n=1 Tax=Rubritalea marina TaxID=361055 RepID=UPI000367E901|nr:L-fucose:H+ symporter permease [Rubritalea marina]
MTKKPVVPKEYLIPFILVTTLFALWGFANDITNPMVKVFSKILDMSAFEGSLVQAAFYGGYCFMALPAAIFITRFSYRAGILTGLTLYAVGCLLFIPASITLSFAPFLACFFIMTCGLSFLETSANPYIMSMGEDETATRRLNLAQAFNPMGALTGMFVAKTFIMSKIDSRTQEERAALPEAEIEAIVQSDLAILRAPYVTLGIVVLVVLVVFAIVKLPVHQRDKSGGLQLGATFGRLFKNMRWIGGVVAQAFYVGAQIMCWTFIIHYGTEVFMAEGMAEQEAESLSQNFNIAAMCLFLTSRFVCTFLLKFFTPGKLLTVLALGGMATILGTIYLEGRAGIYCLVATSGCMALMFPTIYGIALEGLKEDAKLGSAGLIMAIGGGCLMPPLQGAIIDSSGVNVSFYLPFICFVVIAIYGFLCRKPRLQAS